MTDTETAEPSREEIDKLSGCVVLEFGAADCGHCQAARPAIESQTRSHPDIRHIKIEDGRGRPLGRSFRVKLWPTLVFLRDGAEVRRLVRPTETEIAEGFAELAGD